MLPILYMNGISLHVGNKIYTQPQNKNEAKQTLSVEQQIRKKNTQKKTR